MPQFEVFKKRTAPMPTVPYVTIQKRGTFGFNRAAFEELGEPEFIELLFDPQARIMGARKVLAGTEHAYQLRPMPGSSSFIISGVAFTKYYDIPIGDPRRYKAWMEDGVLCVDLAGPSVEVTSSRQTFGQRVAQVVEDAEVGSRVPAADPSENSASPRPTFGDRVAEAVREGGSAGSVVADDEAWLSEAGEGSRVEGASAEEVRTASS